MVKKERNKLKVENIMFLFRRDLRIRDNIGLIYAAKYEPILPVFIFDAEQLSSNHASNNFIQLMCEAVADLDQYLKKQGSRLCCFYGKPCNVVKYLIEKYKPAVVIYNADYSQYSKTRDAAIRLVCREMDTPVVEAHDVTLLPPERLLAAYSYRYWEFVKNIGKISVEAKKCHTKFVRKIFAEEWRDYGEFYKPNSQINVSATRKAAIARIHHGEDDFVASRKTLQPGLMISAHLKLGLISPREIFDYVVAHWQRENAVDLVKQLIWRDFYFAFAMKINVGIDVSMPRSIYEFIDHRFHKIKWLDDPVEIKAMWSGKTGIPLIDAGVRELNKTGFMHNRARLLVGFFSVKILRINPFGKWGGQRYFSRKLIDACYANNTGNWHWVASDMLDSSGQRYSRGFAGRPSNPQKTLHHDPGCVYVKKWIPEIRGLENDEIEHWHKIHKKLAHKCDYIAPIVNVKKRWKEWLKETSPQ